MAKERFLFRGKRTNAGKWIVGYLYALSETFNPFIMLVNKCGTSYEVDRATVCQCTGLYDSTKWEELTREEQEHFLLEWNSKENRRNTKEDWHGRLVFENDIVSLVYDGKAYVYKVVWDESELDFKATNGKENYGRNFQYLTCCEDVKVLGNSFDNTDLMEVKK